MKQIENLVELGKRLKNSDELEAKIYSAENRNPWFTERFVRNAVHALINEMLDEAKLKEWLARYSFHPVNKTIGLIFAGNIPLVGFHDFLCCYLAGCKIKIKLSSKDDLLFPFILKQLEDIDPAIKAHVEIVEQLAGFDAVIATGSNNTNRYFEYYFRNYPKILRKNRNSVAIVTGKETVGELEKLSDDVFMYFGFGCRNVSKLYVPQGYDLTQLFPAFEKGYKWLHGHNKFMNNYDYSRTILMLNRAPHLANEFLMLVESTAIPSSIATLNYEFWQNEQDLTSHLSQNASQIQCITAAQPNQWKLPTVVAFGQTQQPQLWDYADGIDTMAFLLNLN
jgi:hypothetical protein